MIPRTKLRYYVDKDVVKAYLVYYRIVLDYMMLSLEPGTKENLI
jgi:hypothetical protein